jgi:hypothetical protein
VKSWLSLVALFAAAILLALVLKVAPPLLVLAAMLGVAGFVIVRLRARVKAEGAVSQASVLGMRAEESDRSGILALPFALFTRGTDPGLERVLVGAWRGKEIKQFTFTCSIEGPGDDRRRLVCAIGPVEAMCPALVAEPETFVTRLGGAAPLARVGFEEGRFGRTFSVWCDDEAFARTFVDDGVAAWLPSLGDDWGFEVAGPLAMVYGFQVHRPDVLSVVQTLGDLLVRVPEQVRIDFAAPHRIEPEEQSEPEERSEPEEHSEPEVSAEPGAPEPGTVSA